MTEARGIDVHTHIVPFDFPAYGGRHGETRWPSMQAGDCGHRHVMIGGRNYRTVGEGCWDVPRRLADMAPMGIGCQVLSPMPELLSYWFAPEDALSFGRHVNGVIAEMVARAPQRFVGLGMVPLQDPDLAARELEKLVADGFRGAEIGSNVNGKPIGDAFFEPFFAAAEQMGAAIFVHALHPAGRDRIIGPGILEQGVGFPNETGFAIASLITGGMLTRHPWLKLAFSHGGGSFGLLLPRITHVWNTVAALREAVAEAPRDQARRLYYDTLVYDVPTLRYLLDSFGPSQLMLGTDYPFPIYERAPVRPVEELGLPAEVREALIHGNARRFLGLG